jgi:hypothetical protein
MTEAEAHAFVARWRFLVSWRRCAERDAFRYLKATCEYLMVFGVIEFCIYVPFFSNSFGAKIGFAIALVLVAQFVFALWMILDLRQVRRVLHTEAVSAIVNRKS